MVCDKDRSFLRLVNETAYWIAVTLVYAVGMLVVVFYAWIVL